ncbi:hypothetical protein CHS0354_031101 [Potamilus streckersoni]|uniref:Structural maintenance of chromosomes protein 5 n=1 Tax=Potamilus streckersoni TaxID=2493646 RepID=A0AAE0RY47_9BIVA|nr:hypothetical protein CHS0354_031101 [Potamilus streckersoni]
MFGPYLNVIIGPNGTGKSTIVCAICLGLGGKTSFLGRAHQPCDFIKHGCNKATIELQLYNPDGEDYLIKREISKNNTSSWTVNNRQASQKAVEEMVSRLSIQVGNLTQFLPQEKVADFAKMTQEELLENTEKAVGSPDMFENHQKLKDATNTVKQLDLAYSNLLERLEQEKQKNARLEQDVKNFEERENYLEKIKILQMKKAWVEYEEKRRLYVNVKEQQKLKAMEVKRARESFAPAQRQLEAAEKEKNNIDILMKNKTASLQEVARRAKENSKENDDLSDKFTEIEDELKFKKEQELTRRKRLSDLKKQLEALQNELVSANDSEDIQPQLDAVNNKMRETNQSLNKVHQDGEQIRMKVESTRRDIQTLQKQLQNIQDVENKRLEVLRARHKDTYDAYMWLKENQNRFKGKIHPPMMLCVNLKNPAMAKYIENHIRMDDLRAFVCEKTEDLKLFMDVMEEQRLRVSAVGMPNDSLEKFRPSFPITELSKYGLHSYMKDLFTCPDAVMLYLCAQYRVHDIPVGDARTKDCLDIIIREFSKLRLFYSSYNQHNVKRSRYDQSLSTRSTKLKDASFLTVSVDENRERELVQQMQKIQAELKEDEDNYRKLQYKSQELDAAMNQLREEKKQLMLRKDRTKKLQSQIDSKKQSVQNVESEAMNLQAEEEKAARKIKDINLKKQRNLEQYTLNTQRCVELSIEKVRLSFQHTSAVYDFNMLEERVIDQCTMLQRAETEFEERKLNLVQCKEVAKKYLEAAKKMTSMGPNEELSDHIRLYWKQPASDDHSNPQTTMKQKSFEGLPNTLEEIDAKIHEHQVRADCTFQADERVVQEYRKRMKEISVMEKQLEVRLAEKNHHHQDIEEAKAHWIQPLKQLISRINDSFSHFMKCLKCAGEVDLSVPGDPEDYGHYGICIRVKFRDGESLKELTPHHQSGGERSVATVLYMLSLQELARCPFRCVDEINQGMDPVNERKIFEFVVKTVSNNSSQYFLITPKLLPDLQYADNMTVFCVYNGPYGTCHTEWNLKKFLKRRGKIED